MPLNTTQTAETASNLSGPLAAAPIAEPEGLPMAFVPAQTSEEGVSAPGCRRSTASRETEIKPSDLQDGCVGKK